MSSIIAIKRGIECTSGLMHESNGNITQALSIFKKTMRTVNGASSAPDSGKGAKSNPNIQETQFAALSEGFSKLVINYNLKFLNILDFELTTNEEEGFKGKLNELICSDNSKVTNSQNKLSRAILNRIVSATPAWRNKSIALSIDTELTIKQLNSTETISFQNVDLMGAKTFDSNNNVVLPTSNEDKFLEIADKIEQTLFNKGETLIIEVKYILDMGTDKVEVYPSELMTDSDGKHLYQINNVAAITSQKIQNALRRYDNSATSKDIAVGEWGADLGTMKAFRSKRKSKEISERSFYFYKDLLNNSASVNDFSEQVNESELIYFQGVLVKGGLFGEGK